MPTFAQHPFSFEGIRTELPPEFKALSPAAQHLAMQSMKRIYAELVQAAENAGTAIFMEMSMAGDDVPDMSIDEIEAFQMGAMLAVTVALERFVAIGILDEQKFGEMLIEMMKDEHKKQEGGA